ncbi:hypothetical protein C1701_16020 [Actinoalloteichus sp. AHMU CJ021]|uniref:Multiple sugar transport system substrate-binding protein n=1 Tax=Actinoalloteichus caeruleus DSM 43889 TaxID=1120930 RepID=A0ABT1JMU9_ACTCY|nr:extracellular solute-binding protein [Actinoalloteichus caeruleus]AUS79604.1 hypothetical protein C1701_16020 [Actinoalloteichus sp. AHMU CJ021]MCP2333865.1 multiple sugar transport system substrate-binding protein [Actinoalloteichus caeruleus DSM 43889]
MRADVPLRGGSRTTTTTALLASLAVTGTLGLAACGSTADDSGTATIHFTWYGNDDRANATMEAVELFESRHEGITVETSFSGFDSYFEKMSTQIAGGSAPDVLQMDAGYLREYAERGALADLDDFTGDVLDIDDVDPAGLRSGETGDGRFAVPLGRSTQTVAYNSRVWAEAGLEPPEMGWTWDDLRAAARTISEHTDGEVHGLTDPGWAIDWFQFWLLQDGKILYTDDGEIGFTEEDLVDYWTYTQEMRDEGAATPVEITTQISGNLDTSPLASGTAGAELSYLGSSAGFFPILGEEMALAPWPSRNGEYGAYASTSIQISVSAGTEHPRESAMLVDFLMNDVEAGRILGTTRGTPPNAEVRAAVAEDLSGVEELLFEFEESVSDALGEAPPPPPRGSGSLKRNFSRIYDSVNFGNLTVEEGAAQLMTEARQLIT